MPAAEEEAKDHAIFGWNSSADFHHLAGALTGWTPSTAADGGPLLSAQAVGPDHAELLRCFAGGALMVRTHPDDLRPRFDYSVPGRVACVWRSSGVWVELWHPETTTAPVAPVQRRIGSPSARLPFGRFSRLRKAALTTKEN